MRAFTILSFIAAASAGNGYIYCKPGECQTSSPSSGSIGSRRADITIHPAESGIDSVRTGGGFGGTDGDSYRSDGKYIRPGSRNSFGISIDGRSVLPVAVKPRTGGGSVGTGVSYNSGLYIRPSSRNSFGVSTNGGSVLPVALKPRTSGGSGGIGVSYNRGGEYIRPSSRNSFGTSIHGVSVLPIAAVENGIRSGISGKPIGVGGDQVVGESVSNEFYTFTAPEEDASAETVEKIAATFKRKNRVIFIKTPENNAARNVALQVAKRVNEEKTHIYVLSHQPDVSEVVEQVEMLTESFRHKPEVQFIQYRTHQDAVNAQQHIQQEYEALGGSSSFINGGVAPVLNYATAKNGVVNTASAKQVNYAKTFNQPGVLNVANQAHGLGASVRQNTGNQLGQYSRPQAINAQQFSGVAPVVNISSGKVLHGNAADQSNKEREETETFIYVLSKEPNIEEIVDKFRELTETSRLKPEVRFVKYSTPQEAVDAQQSIQQQYDALGGSSISDI